MKRSPDLTQRQRQAGTGMDTRMRWLCGCTVKRQPGAVVRNGLLLRCAACAAHHLRDAAEMVGEHQALRRAA